MTIAEIATQPRPTSRQSRLYGSGFVDSAGGPGGQGAHRSGAGQRESLGCCGHARGGAAEKDPSNFTYSRRWGWVACAKFERASLAHASVLPIALVYLLTDRIQEHKESMSNNIQEQIEKEREQARAACDVSGSTSPECAAAWDAVEELQAEASHQREEPKKSSFEQYCADNPDADECRLYED